MKLGIEIDNDTLDICKGELSGWHGVNVTDSQLETILKADMSLAQDLSKYGDVDTVGREQLIDGVVKNVLGMTKDWPMGGSTPEYKKSFYEEFFRLAEEKGLDVSGWSEEDKAKRL